MFSGKELEEREDTAEQDDTNVGELAATLQGWRCGEDEMGDRKTEEQEPATSTADRKLSGDGDYYTITIGLSVIKVGNIQAGLQSHRF
jgi:hypothetical protein